jgi:hypothetical protein
MSLYQSTPRRKSLQECQLNWKIRFWSAYRAQLPTAAFVGLVVAAVCAYVLQEDMGLGSIVGMGACALVAIALAAVGLVLSSLEPYPTAAQHAKSNAVINMYDELKRQELGGNRSNRITRN